MFSGHATGVVSVVSGPSAPDSHRFVLALGAELAREAGRVWLVESVSGAVAQALGCQPLLPWRASVPLERQLIQTGGGLGLIHAPGCMAGDATLASAVTAAHGCSFLLFDGGRFSSGAAPIDPSTAQILIVLLGRQDAEAGYALVRALRELQSPARVLLIGDIAGCVSQAASRFMGWTLENCRIEADLCQIGNTPYVASSNTLNVSSSLKWVLSRISQNYHSGTAHGGGSKRAKEVCRR